MDMVQKRIKSQQAHRIMGWLITAQTGFSINEDLVKNLSEKIALLTGEVDGTGNQQSLPYYMVAELDRDALNKAKKELQKVEESRKG